MMTPRTIATRIVATFAAFGLFLLIAGCGDDSGLGQRYKVTGTITYKGEKVEKGRIAFNHVGTEGKDAAGDIVDGAYSLTTVTPDDGALPGKYTVTITAREMDTTKLKEIAKGGQFHHDKEFMKAAASAKQLVPAKYALADTSKLTAEVKAESNKFDFDLQD